MARCGEDLPDVPRVSIYVDAALRKKMSELGFNWSEIAQAAFATEIRRRDDEEKRRMSAVIEPMMCLGS